MNGRRWLLLVLLVLLVLLGGAALLVRWTYFPTRVLRLTYEVELPRPGADAAWRQTLDAVRRRVERTIRGALIEPAGRQIHVDLPRVSPEAIRTLKRRITRSLLFELRRVDDRSDLVRRMVAARPPPSPIETRRNDYRTPDGRTVEYVTLISPVRSGLESYLQQMPTDLRPPLDRELALGEGWGPHGRQTLYELYVVQRRPDLTGQQVQRADAFHDAASGRYEVSVTFTSDGARQFEALTRSIVGQRLAIMLDGTVSSAPVVMSPIAGGQARITLGGFRDALTQRIEAEELAEALEAGALPARLTLLREQPL